MCSNTSRPHQSPSGRSRSAAVQPCKAARRSRRAARSSSMGWGGACTAQPPTNSGMRFLSISRPSQLVQNLPQSNRHGVVPVVVAAFQGTARGQRLSHCLGTCPTDGALVVAALHQQHGLVLVLRTQIAMIHVSFTSTTTPSAARNTRNDTKSSLLSTWFYLLAHLPPRPLLLHGRAHLPPRPLLLHGRAHLHGQP